MKIITVTNQKGGTGKTSTTNALMAGLHQKGYKVLAVDLDPQCNLSFILKTDLNKPTALGILAGEAKIKDTIQQSEIGDFIASSKQLSNADKLLDSVGREYKLKKALESVKADYDFILIDTPPALSILTINALTACNSVIIPAVADIFSLQGIERLAETIEPIKEYTNSSLFIEGILLTKYTGDRTNLNKSLRETAKKTAEKLNTKLFDTVIRESVTVKESQLMLSNVFDYAPKASVTADYESFINELLQSEAK